MQRNMICSATYRITPLPARVTLEISPSKVAVGAEPSRRKLSEGSIEGSDCHDLKFLHYYCQLHKYPK